MKDPFARHNQRVRDSNRPPAVVPDPPLDADIAGVIAAYNAAEAEQAQRLGALFAYCTQNRKHALNFVGGARWTNFPFASDRPDLSMERFVGPLITYIKSIE